MTDYDEEQAGEMEALESIYCGELEVISADPPRVFTLPVKTTEYEDSEGSEGIFVLLKFTHTPKYPDELPILEIEESENLDNEMAKELLEYLESQMEENRGMVMVFTAVSEAIEWLGKKSEENKARREEELRIAKEIAEEEERRKLEGTKVSVESFLAWKAQFDKERLANCKKIVRDESKLTGKELFLSNDNLKDSDIKFLEAAGEAVAVDESLFEDLDDLDLEDNDDDQNWRPGKITVESD